MKVEVFKAEYAPEIQALTNERLQRFVGGILEIINQVEHYIYRGEIQAVRLKKEPAKLSDGNTITDIAVCLDFAWVKGAEYDSVPKGEWKDQERLDYESTLVCANIVEDDRRLIIASAVTNEILAFFPPKEEP